MSRVVDQLTGTVWRSPRGRVSVRLSPRTIVVCLVLAVVCLAVGAISMTSGTMSLSVGEVLHALVGGADERTQKVVVGMRLPRVVTGVLVGAALGISGAVFQSLSRNVLGSPDIIGFTTGAATGVVVHITVLHGSPTTIPLAALAGGLGCAVAVYLLSSRRGTTGGYRLVLVGIGVGAVLAALNSLMLTRADLDTAISAQIWLTGSLNARTWEHALAAAIGCAVFLPVVLVTMRQLTLMEMGDDSAVQLGVRVEATRRLAMIAGVGLVAVATAVAGPISFVALAAPQLVKRLARTGGGAVIASGFMGAALLTGADLASRNLPLAMAVPVGLMTGVTGGLYLIWLLTRKASI